MHQRHTASLAPTTTGSAAEQVATLWSPTQMYGNLFTATILGIHSTLWSAVMQSPSRLQQLTFRWSLDPCVSSHGVNCGAMKTFLKVMQQIANLVVANISSRCAKENCLFAMLEWHIVVVSIVQAHYERFQGCRFIHPNIWPSTQGDGDRVSNLARYSWE